MNLHSVCYVPRSALCIDINQRLAHRRSVHQPRGLFTDLTQGHGHSISRPSLTKAIIIHTAVSVLVVAIPSPLRAACCCNVLVSRSTYPFSKARVNSTACAATSLIVGFDRLDVFTHESTVAVRECCDRACMALGTISTASSARTPVDTLSALWMRAGSSSAGTNP